MVASLELEPQRIDIQFSTNVLWFAAETEQYWADAYPVPRVVASPVRSMYARLAHLYQAEPAVASHDGGLAGDRFDF